jgi:hypothetical protein
MDDCPVGAHRLEVIDSGSGERLYTAMRDQAERGREFQRRVRWLWLRRELNVAPVHGSVIDLREVVPAPRNAVPLDALPLNAVPLSSLPLNSVSLSSLPLNSMAVQRERCQEDSA